MTDPSGDSTQPARQWQPLDPIQRRVLGVLIEKAKTTPAGYPMTVNAITAGCNQKNNREPEMALEAFDVEKALSELEKLGAVSEIDWLGRAVKYKHHAYEWLGVTKVESAVITELLLRGEQPLGDLRARAARMEPIEDLAALKPIVDGLVERGLVIELSPAGRGQMVTHGLLLAHEHGQRGSRSGSGSPASHLPAASSEASALELASLQAELTRLRSRLEELELRVARLAVERLP